MSEDASGGVTGAYQRLLQNELSAAEVDAAVSEYHIPSELPRCVLLLHMVQVQGRNAIDILSEVIPLSVNDVLVAMDNHNAALIKCTSGIEDIEDLHQLAGALQETVLGETGLPLTIGIGEFAHTVSELHQSYRQARRAMEIGRIFCGRDPECSRRAGSSFRQQQLRALRTRTDQAGSNPSS